MYISQKKMEATAVSIKDVLSCREFPVVVVKYYTKDDFIMGYHVYNSLDFLDQRGVVWCHGNNEFNG